MRNILKLITMRTEHNESLSAPDECLLLVEEIARLVIEKSSAIALQINPNLSEHVESLETLFDLFDQLVKSYTGGATVQESGGKQFGSSGQCQFKAKRMEKSMEIGKILELGESCGRQRTAGSQNTAFDSQRTTKSNNSIEVLPQNSPTEKDQMVLANKCKELAILLSNKEKELEEK
jgi:hypothetical protein